MFYGHNTILYNADEKVFLSYISIGKDFIPLKSLTPLSLVVIMCCLL
jgi:hypothetical protein